MLTYHEYEKKVYDWLIAKHQKDPTFTFSVRQMASKGAERDYFIGTEKSKYFGTTLWFIPVGFPGSASDLIDIFFRFDNNKYWFNFEFSQTKSPDSTQNASALNLIRSIKEKVRSTFGFSYEGGPDTKIEGYIAKSPKPYYGTVEAMLDDLDDSIKLMLPIIKDGIEQEKGVNPGFTAHNYTFEEFENLQDKLERRRAKYSNVSVDTNISAFSQIIERVKNELNNDTKTKDLFLFENSTAKYVWIKDKSGVIGNSLAHYEIINRDSKVHVEVHFEGKKEVKDIFSRTISVLPDKAEWFNWNNSKSIRYNGPFDINDTQITEKICEGLYYLETNLGIKLRQILKSLNPDSGLDKQTQLNQILFGAPGTGKTYNTVNKALKIIAPNFDLTQKREIIKAEFEKYVKKGRIVFTTFHQSMSYEDFVEGIKPEMKGEEDGIENTDSTIGYKIKDGIFKEIVENSRSEVTLDAEKGSLYIPESNFKYPINKVSLGNSQLPEDDVIYQYCMQHNCIAIGFGEDIDFKDVKNRSDIREKYKEAGINIEGKMDFNISAIERLVLWMKPGQLVFVSYGNSRLKAIGVVDGDYYCDSTTPIRYSQFRKVKWLHKDLNLPIQEIYENKFSQQTIYQIDQNKINKDYFKGSQAPSKEDTNNYVLIIDEINRGNVSQIFGELITLIEKDKRLGNNEALEIMLPYSKKVFGVPNNLYIIGTMNTADRSVEALDTALRRRFSFEEIIPKPSIIKDYGKLKDEEGVLKVDGYSIDLVKMLEVINERIEILLDRDHLIGHSYFMNVENTATLKESFSKQIIPLLQEYFFGDYGKISLVLGEGFCVGKKNDNVAKIFAFAKDYEVDVFSEKIVYTLHDPNIMEDDEFIKALKTLMKEE